MGHPLTMIEEYCKAEIQGLLIDVLAPYSRGAPSLRIFFSKTQTINYLNNTTRNRNRSRSYRRGIHKGSYSYETQHLQAVESSLFFGINYGICMMIVCQPSAKVFVIDQYGVLPTCPSISQPLAEYFFHRAQTFCAWHFD